MKRYVIILNAKVIVDYSRKSALISRLRNLTNRYNSEDNLLEVYDREVGEYYKPSYYLPELRSYNC